MRVLFYGGCHADVLHKLFARFCLESDYIGDLLTNYLLIAEKDSFPYEDLHKYDYVVYNPILNKGNFNTIYLKDYCDAHGIRSVCYPWLQWTGYAPKSHKVEGLDWIFPDLLRERSRFARFEDFRSWVLDGWLTEADIKNNFEYTTNYLTDHEVKGGCDIKVSDFILENYCQRRLFVTPDHPATVTYAHIAVLVAEKLGVNLDPSLQGLVSELQSEHYLPILPRVVDALGLGFRSDEYSFHQILGPRVYGLSEWLRIFYFGGKNVAMLTPQWGESVIIGDTQVSVSAQQLIFGLPNEDGFKVLSAPDVVERALPDSRFLKLGGQWWCRHELGIYQSLL